MILEQNDILRYVREIWLGSWLVKKDPQKSSEAGGVNLPLKSESVKVWLSEAQGKDSKGECSYFVFYQLFQHLWHSW